MSDLRVALRTGELLGALTDEAIHHPIQPLDRVLVLPAPGSGQPLGDANTSLIGEVLKGGLDGSCIQRDNGQALQ